MTSRRVIPGVLHNFLGTFTSRYSDFKGYWVFGFLVEGIDAVRINLLDEAAKKSDSTPLGFACRLAKQKFREQTEKAGLPKAWLREAHFAISKFPQSKQGLVNGQISTGYDVTFRAHVLTDLNRVYECTATIFVAPHNPRIERRRPRRRWWWPWW